MLLDFFLRVQFGMEDNRTHSSPEQQGWKCGSYPPGVQLPLRKIQCSQHSRWQQVYCIHFQVAETQHTNVSITMPLNMASDYGGGACKLGRTLRLQNKKVILQTTMSD